MIPDWNAVESAARAVTASVPAGVAGGETAVALYGLGFLGRFALPNLRARGVEITACYDANPALAGTRIDGIPVHAPATLAAQRPAFVIVTARHAIRPVSAMLGECGIAHVSYDAWQVAQELDAFRGVHDRLTDDQSKSTLRAVMLAMLTGDARHCEAVCERDQYFGLPRFWGWANEVYVDAGAFVGDSVERFIWEHNGVFSKIHAFEPGRRQFAALQARAERLTREWALDPGSIAMMNAALGERAGIAAGSSGMTSFAVSEDGQGASVNVVSLDDVLGGAPVTFLKADVEGMEMALLRGAQDNIRRHRPKIAVCVYHYPTDIPEIANYLAALVPAYRFALRHHSPQLMETVLYCWID